MSDEKDLLYLCCANDGKLWLPDHSLPLIAKSKLEEMALSSYVIGEFEQKEIHYTADSEGFPNEEFESLRSQLSLSPRLFNLAGKAIQLDHMRNTQRFCSQCGGINTFDAKHNAMVCQQCHAVHYPRVSPCVIVAVRREREILLAQHPRHRNGMYTVIAGFVEAGETLEQCVEREVYEETGIVVTNIRYFDSQPWAFPSNIMVAFVADYASGEINPDYEELTDAQWFDLEALPLVAPEGTIARRLIDEAIELRE